MRKKWTRRKPEIEPRVYDSKETLTYVGGDLILKKLQAIGLRPISEGHKAVRYDREDLDRFIDALKGGMRA